MIIIDQNYKIMKEFVVEYFGEIISVVTTAFVAWLKKKWDLRKIKNK